MDNYLGSLKNSEVKSLQDLVDWNSAHAEVALTEGTFIREKAYLLANTKRRRLPKPSAAGAGTRLRRLSRGSREATFSF